MERDQRSLRNILIHRPMQREFTLTMIAIMVAGACVVGVVIHYTMRGLVVHLPNTISRTVLERLVLDADAQLIASSILIIFAAVIATGIFGVFFLHRVAGPVYRFRQTLKQIGSGEVPNEVRIRKNDFFSETANELNRAIKLIRQINATSQRLELALKDLPDDKVPADLANKISEVEAALADFKKVR